MKQGVPRTAFALTMGMGTFLIVAGWGWAHGGLPGLMIGAGVGLVTAFFVTGLTRYQLAQIPIRKTPETDPVHLDEMSIVVTCECTMTYRLPARYAGRRCRCRECGGRIRVPCHEAGGVGDRGA